MKNIFKIALFLFCMLALSLPVFAAENDLSNTQYIVKFKEPIVLLAEENDALTPLLPEEGIYTTDNQTATTLQNQAEVEYIEPDYPVYLADGDIMPLQDPNDPLYNQQWNLSMIGYPITRNQNFSGRDLRIGIVDTGISTTHEDLIGRVVGGYNFCDNNEDYNDLNGHGSFIAGIIGASTDNQLGITGGSDAKLYALKAFDGKETYISTIVRAIDLAVNTYHCHILNLSFTTEYNSQTLQNTIHEAVEKDVFVIAAVGNEGSEQINYPAAYDGVIGVASINENKQHSSFSNWNQSVDVAVPGENITSIRISEENRINGYGTGSGTSYATPHMTLIVSYLLGLDPSLTPDELELLFQNHSEDLGSIGYDTQFGWGLPSLSEFYQYYGGLDILSDDLQNFESSFFNYTNNIFEAVHIWALYDTETGLLLDTEVEELNLKKNDITKTTYSIPDIKITSYQLKSFWFDSLTSLMPLSEGKTYTSGE